MSARSNPKDSTIFDLMKNVRILFILLGLALSPSLWAQQPQSQFAQSGICPLYIPNAFTPNGDDINDRFVLMHGEDCELQSFQIQIFDRWGRLVFTSESMSEENSWDGKFENNELKAGVYLYRVSATLLSYNNREAKANKVEKQGSVLLIR